MSDDGCRCSLCRKERAFWDEHGACYRCFSELPCSIAEEDGESCLNVLDRIRVAAELDKSPVPQD